MALARFGQNKLIEVTSKSQTFSSQQLKISKMTKMSVNPNTDGRAIGKNYNSMFNGWFFF